MTQFQASQVVSTHLRQPGTKSVHSFAILPDLHTVSRNKAAVLTGVLKKEPHGQPKSVFYVLH